MLLTALQVRQYKLTTFIRPLVSLISALFNALVVRASSIQFVFIQQPADSIVMRFIIIVSGLLALAQLVSLAQGRAIIGRADIEKRQAKDQPQCNHEDTDTESDEEEIIFDMDEDEDSTLDLHQTAEEEERD